MVLKFSAPSVHVSPRKARVVVDLIRGKKVLEALVLLNFCQKSSARYLKSILENALCSVKSTRKELDAESLFIELAYVDKASNAHLRRWRPRAMGRASSVQKGASHITLVLNKK